VTGTKVPVERVHFIANEATYEPSTGTLVPLAVTLSQGGSAKLSLHELWHTGSKEFGGRGQRDLAEAHDISGDKGAKIFIKLR
jgi:hypothetical protein